MGYDITKMRSKGRKTVCGRYYVDDETAREIERLVKEIGNREKWKRLYGDIHPTEEAPVLVSKEGKVKVAWQRWGFAGFQKKGVIINSRSETVMEKLMFRDSVMTRRAVIPCAGFYEWSREKERCAFFREDVPVLFLAGFYKTFEDQKHFVILTTEANSSVAPVHDRMPLILEQEEVAIWLKNESAFPKLLKKTPVALKRQQDYEQQTLFFD